MPPAGNRPRLPALTSIRFLAALWVALFHLQALNAFTFSTRAITRLASVGYCGVSFFFVLSGFVLTYTYASRPIRLRSFWQARVARIYPAFLFALLLTAPAFLYCAVHIRANDPHLVIPEWTWAAHHLTLTLLLCLTLLESWIPQTALAWNTPSWSLSVEVFFYLVFPFLLPRLGRLSRPLLLAILPAGCALTLAATLLYAHSHPPAPGADILRDISPWVNILKFNPLVRLPEFLMGIAAGLLFLRRHNPNPHPAPHPNPHPDNQQDRRLAWPLLLASLTLLTAIVCAAPRIPYLTLHTALPAPAFTALIYALALQPTGLGLLASRPLEILGNASYAFYLIHAFTMSTFFLNLQTGATRHQSAAGFLTWLLLTIAASLAIDVLIERPLRRLLRPTRTTTIPAPPIPARA